MTTPSHASSPAPNNATAHDPTSPGTAPAPGTATPAPTPGTAAPAPAGTPSSTANAHTSLHPMKHETFDLAAMVNIDPKGYRRIVDVYSPTPFGLYMARGADHPSFGYIEAWLLRDPSIRVTKFHFRPGFDTGQGVYIDIARNEQVESTDGTVWKTTDYYIDIVEFPGRLPDVLDLDELQEAFTAGLISHAELTAALGLSARVLEGIQAHGSLEAWLENLGMPLTWKDPAEIELVPPMR